MIFNSKTLKSLEIAISKRENLRKITNALRLVNGLGDELSGLVIDQYKDHFACQIFDPVWLKNIDLLKDFLEEQFKVDYLILKDRTQSTASTLDVINVKVLKTRGTSKTIVQENGVNFEVDLNDTLNTGLFLDMRSNRLMVASNCQGKKVLNCFSYTCSFGVHARIEGARELVNVDVSKKILEKGLRNYELNMIKPARNEFIKADALGYLEKAGEKKNHFDVIILDPPSFARSQNGVFSVEKDISTLIELSVKALNSNGKLFVSTNYSAICHNDLKMILKRAISAKVIKKITEMGQDRDFPGSGLRKESHLAALWVEF